MVPPEPVATGSALQLHASAVAVDGRGCLITGAPGSGKSALAARLIALGAVLVADDRVDLSVQGDAVRLAAPAAIDGLIEVRGVGILRLETAAPAELAFLVDLDLGTDERLPPASERELLGRVFPVIPGAGQPDLATAVMLMLRGAELLDPDRSRY